MSPLVALLGLGALAVVLAVASVLLRIEHRRRNRRAAAALVQELRGLRLEGRRQRAEARARAEMPPPNPTPSRILRGPQPKAEG